MPEQRALVRNGSLFVWFRVLFNARYYYPVLAVFFLDLGLTTAQYALLNVAWAAAIVLLEIPSGALADQIGRRTLVRFAAALMVIEMAVLGFAPAGNATLLFALFLLNRIISGAAEAAASGADEALAFDSLAEAGCADRWPALLERLARWQSAAFFFAMLVGAAVYDANFLNRMLGTHFAAAQAHRFPVYLTLCNALGALAVTWMMCEPHEKPAHGHPPLHAAWLGMRETARWIAGTPFVLFVLMAGVLVDSLVRLFLTLGSSYYRLIGIPEAAFGLIGSAFSLLGIVAVAGARRLYAARGPAFNFSVMGALALAGFAGLAWVRGFWALLPVACLGLAFSGVTFLMSACLNAAANPANRATLLSFRGLALNLAYGMAGILFAALFAHLRSGHPGSEETVLALALPWLPAVFSAGVALLVLYALKNPPHPHRSGAEKPSRLDAAILNSSGGGASDPR